MDFNDFTAGADDHDRRLDKIIKRICKDLPQANIYSAIRKGLIKVNHKKAKPQNPVKQGDVISVASFLLDNPLNKAEQKTKVFQFKLEDIFVNEHIRIINKPYDILTQASQKTSTSLDQIIKEDYSISNSSASLSFTPGPLHRLDKKTTGLLAFSNSLKGAQWFTKAVSDKTIRKIYAGLCQGEILHPVEWKDNLQKEESTQTKNFHTMKVSKEESKTAVTKVIPLATGCYDCGNFKEKVTLCQYEIMTGIKHQIRLQSAYHGHPLLGDTAYGGQKITDGQDFYLHAGCLIIPNDNPLDLPPVITCPISQKFQKILKYSLINWDGNFII